MSNQQEYQDYRQGKVRSRGDIDNKNSHLKAIQAQLVIPIVLQEDTIKVNKFYPLWGWLITNQDDYRRWQPEEIELCQTISTQLAIAIQQIDYYDQLRIKSENLSQTLERERAAKEELQKQAVEMLRTVRPAFSGDLTVRANVTENEIGTNCWSL